MDEVYEKLRERLDMFPQGFPKTKNGVELEILEHLFSTDEAKIALSLALGLTEIIKFPNHKVSRLKNT